MCNAASEKYEYMEDQVFFEDDMENRGPEKVNYCFTNDFVVLNYFEGFKKDESKFFCFKAGEKKRQRKQRESARILRANRNIHRYSR